MKKKIEYYVKLKISNTLKLNVDIIKRKPKKNIYKKTSKNKFMLIKIFYPLMFLNLEFLLNLFQI